MIPNNVAIYVALSPVDFRRGFNGLSEMARRLMKREVKEGGVFVFANQRRDRLKLLWADKVGMNLFYRRIYRGTFEMPSVADVGELHVAIDRDALMRLLVELKLFSSNTNRGG
jgi:transposase